MRLLTRQQAFGVAAIIALVVASLVYLVLSQQARPQAPTQPVQQTVVVASQDISAFKTITAEMLTTKEMPIEAIPTGALGTIDQAVGKIAQTQIVAGQPIRQADLSSRTAAQGLTFVIPQGMRAVTVALDPISGVGGFVYPGDHVDVLATFEQDEITLTKTILQDIEVLAMNELTSRPAPRQPQATDQEATAQTGTEAPAAEQVKSATLAMTPDQVQSLILSAVKGSVHMVLRPREDNAIVSLASLSNWALMGQPPPAEKPKETEQGQAVTGAMMTPVGWPQGMSQPPMGVPSAAAPGPAPAPTVEVIRGNEREIVTP